ncbi:Exportin-T [Nymphon striatum]|nr:Exportin-T [Nymphon striatum]
MMDQDLWSLLSEKNAQSHSLTIQRQQLEYLQELDNGWEICMNKLASGHNEYEFLENLDNVTFFCFQVIENFARTSSVKAKKVKIKYTCNFKEPPCQEHAHVLPLRIEFSFRQLNLDKWLSEGQLPDFKILRPMCKVGKGIEFYFSSKGLEGLEKYFEASEAQQHIVRHFFTNWIQSQNQAPSYIHNKAAQVFCLLFLVDYPHRWPAFFHDVLNTLPSGLAAVENYLRLLKAIDSEVVDREIVHSRQEMDRNTLIKDKIRDDCVHELVNSWNCILLKKSRNMTIFDVIPHKPTYHIITGAASPLAVDIGKTEVAQNELCFHHNSMNIFNISSSKQGSYQSMNSTLVCLCLEVIGAYISWIDIKLIANDEFVPKLVNFLTNHDVRECACDCIHEIICKGMEPIQKTHLIESFVNVLDLGKIISNLNADDDVDFKVKLAKLVNGMGTSLYQSWLKLTKAKNADKSITEQAIHDKASFMMMLLNDEDDDVSSAVFDFAKQYIQMLKALTVFPNHDTYMRNMLMVLFNKFKYDEYNFESQGENEALFDEYRKQLKVIFDNLAQLDKNFVVNSTKDFIMNIFNSLHVSTFQDIELAITLLYHLGEAIQVSNGNYFTGEPKRVSVMHEMMIALLTSEVINNSHMIVNLQFFETVVRYEKFFLSEPNHTTNVVLAFLDERGMNNMCPKVRSRTAYLFHKFVKSLKVLLYPLTREILNKLNPFLRLQTLSPENDHVEQLITHEDQIYVYETVAILIVSSQLDNVVSSISTTKAYSNNQTMKSLNCHELYLDALKTFLSALAVPDGQQLLHPGVRQNLHRLVVCLEDEILPYIPDASEKLLKPLNVKSIQEYIPLINQIMNKFKSSWSFHNHITPFLTNAFLPIVKTISVELTQPYDTYDEIATREHQSLRHSYISFISSIVTNNVTEVMVQDLQALEKILSTIVDVAQEYPDPSAQKNCFFILRGLLDIWSRKDMSNDFAKFFYTLILNACFSTPLKKSFDLSDGQSAQVLNEIALCLTSMYEKKVISFGWKYGDDGSYKIKWYKGDYCPRFLDVVCEEEEEEWGITSEYEEDGDTDTKELLQFLRSNYLNTYNFPNGASELYCEALKSGRKQFQTYLVVSSVTVIPCAGFRDELMVFLPNLYVLDHLPTI